ncbi:MAG: hypothetical protein IJ065_13435 [Eubacterium sp.]|nr:hypothetical protein [Eubacterium sp.]
MKLSDILASKTEIFWKEASEKNFLTEMAMGNMDKAKFCNYMLQDYLYLLDYIDILKDMKKTGVNEKLGLFLDDIICDTENETYRVHVPAMKNLGISENEIEKGEKAAVISDYVGYMKKVLSEEGILAGLTAMLQCSWNYAYIAEVIFEKYKKELETSEYKFWFDAYNCKEYTDSNRLWIDALDNEASGIDRDETEKLCEIFITCSKYENSLWDYLDSYETELNRN